MSSDAPNDALGAVIMQLHDPKWLSVTYALRPVRYAECRYSEIEKEYLGIVFACEKIHEYIYGTKIASCRDRSQNTTGENLKEFV